LAADRHAPANPGDSSSSPNALATTPPYTSASMSSVGIPARADSVAIPVATVVRPGAPVGPQTATTRPLGGGAKASARSVSPTRGGSARRGSDTARAGAAVGRPSRSPTAALAASSRAVEPASSETRVVIPMRSSRRRARSSAAGCTPTTATPDARKAPTASVSNRRRSADTIATDACPVVAMASTSPMSTQRRKTVIGDPGRSSAATRSFSQLWPLPAVSRPVLIRPRR